MHLRVLEHRDYCDHTGSRLRCRQPLLPLLDLLFYSVNLDILYSDEAYLYLETFLTSSSIVPAQCVKEPRLRTA